MSLFPALRALEGMQHLVAAIDARARFVLARKGCRIV